MKKSLFTVLSLILCFALLAGCSPSAQQPGTSSPDPAPSGPNQQGGQDEPKNGDLEPALIRIGGLKGPTSMGMVKMLKDEQEGKAYNEYEFTLAGSADELTPKLVTGELDILAVPANLASVLYNNTEGKVKLLAVNTLGVVYIVEDGDTIQSMQDLKGKTIYATGRGSTPEYALNYLLSQNGLDPERDVTIDWKSEPTEVVALMGENPGSIAMMPQPYVTVMQNTLTDLRIALDLTEEWEKLDNGSALITGVLVVRSAFAEQYAGQLKEFLKEYKASTEYVNEKVKEAAALVEEFDIVKAAIAEKAIPYCNITYMAGAEMKSAMEGYLEVLYEQNPKSVGGTLPGADFYYGAE